MFYDDLNSITLVHGNQAKLKRVQIKIRNFRAWPYCGAYHSLKFLSLALLRPYLVSCSFFKEQETQTDIFRIL